jgi:cell division protein FtsL
MEYPLLSTPTMTPTDPDARTDPDEEDTMKTEKLSRVEKFVVSLFGIIAALIVVPGLVLVAISIFSDGSIYLSH